MTELSTPNDRLFELIQTEENPIRAVKLLIKEGADLNARDAYGATPLIRAAECEQKAILKFLIKSGAELNFVDNDGLTALDYALDDDIGQILYNAGALSGTEDDAEEDESEAT